MFAMNRPRLVAIAGSLMLSLYAVTGSAVPVFSVSVNGDPAVSFEELTVCDGISSFSCVGSGSEGDLVVSYFELSADPAAWVAGSFLFYNASETETLSVLATVLFPTTGAFTTPTIAVGTGLASPAGGDLSMTVNGFVDYPSVASISAADCLVADFDTVGCGASSGVPATLNVLANIGFSLAFDLAPDMQVSIGFDPESAFGAGTYFSISSVVVPVPAAVWLFGSALGLLGWARRKTQ